MSISYDEPIFNSADPQPPIDLAERIRIREARDAQHQAVATAVKSLVTQVNSDSPKVTSAAGKSFADAMGLEPAVGAKALATLVSNASPVNIAATGKFVTDTSVPVDQSTLQIGSVTYKFVSGAPAAEGEVLIEATVADTLTNLVNAIAADGDSKTAGKHFCVVAHPQVTAAANATTLTLTSILRGAVGNGYALVASTDPDSHFDASAATMGSGAGCTEGVNHTVTINTKVYTFVGDTPNAEGEVLAEATAAAELDNLKSAVNGEVATFGTKHYCTAHADVEATTNTNTTQLLSARAVGSAANAYPISTTAPNLSIQGGLAYFAGGYNVSAAQVMNAAAGAILDKEEVYAVAQNASVTGLTAGLLYKYLVLTYGATYGSALSGRGTGTNLMALTASANLHLLIVPIM